MIELINNHPYLTAVIVAFIVWVITEIANAPEIDE